MKKGKLFNWLIILFVLSLLTIVSTPAQAAPPIPPSETSPPEDLVINPVGGGSVSVAESDRGWGGGAKPWEISDGKRTYPEWQHGLAFTGGTRGWAGESCGWRQATITFENPQTFNRVVVWHFRPQDVPNTYKIQAWDGQAWVDLFSTTNGHNYLLYPLDATVPDWGSSVNPTENSFASVTSSKVRFALNNCDIEHAYVEHGWIWEFEVYNDTPSGTQLKAQPDQMEVYPGDALSVDLIVENADNLYGLQATCSADPAILSIQSSDFGDIFANPLIGANLADSAAGTWLGAMSLQSPAEPFSGDGHFADLTFEGLSPGTATITCAPLFSDRDGFELDVTAIDSQVTVLPFGTINGAVTYQGRLEHAGIEVTATGPDTHTALTDSAGAFEFDQLKHGSYAIRVDPLRYLPSCTTAEITGSEPLTLTTTTLKGGDVNDDEVINIGDATLVGANFGQEIPPADVRADINADEKINVQDLSILGGNFGLSGCQSW